MGFFKKLFKPKPGGTFVGNLLRKTVPILPPPKPLIVNGAPQPSPNQTLVGPAVQPEMTTKEKMKKYSGWIIAGVVAAAFGIVSLVKGGRSGGRRRRK